MENLLLEILQSATAQPVGFLMDSCAPARRMGCVTVLAEGFEYKKVKFNSLSAIAKKITGTKWNGLVFFGIKRMEDYRK